VPVPRGRAVSGVTPPTVSDELERWIIGDQPKTLATIIQLFGPRSFALIFVLLMALPALPLPTAGATHILEAVTMLVALQLVVGRRCIWLPAGWQRLGLGAPSWQKSGRPSTCSDARCLEAVEVDRSRPARVGRCHPLPSGRGLPCLEMRVLAVSAGHRAIRR